MAVYKNANKASPIVRMETDAIPDGNFIYFHVDKVENKDKVKQWLTSKEVGQSIVAETTVDGRPVLITHGEKSRDEMLKALEARGDKPQLYHYKAPFSEIAWKTGAKIAFVGQGLQLLSAGLRPNRKLDWSLVGLAVPNLIATTIVLIFGAQRTPDKHKLRAIKTDVNEAVDEYMPDPSRLPSVDDTRAKLREEEPKPRTAGQRVHDFLKRYSVVFGEIGLRYFGAFALAFPANKWKEAFGKLKAGSFKEAFKIGRAPSSLMLAAGLLSLSGKTIALTAKAPDPYNPDNPDPNSTAGKLQWFREKIVFRLGGIIETVAFGLVAADAFTNKNKKMSFKQIKEEVKDAKGVVVMEKGKPKERFLPGFNAANAKDHQYQDFISGTGGSMFTVRYIIRYWAPFGVKEMDMKEMYAHVVDALAQVPPDKLPNAMADAAAEIAQHFKGEHLEYGMIFTKLKDQLYRDHHIALDNLGTEPAERMAKMNATAPAPANPKPEEKPVSEEKPAQQAAALAPRTAMDMVTVPASDKHAEKITKGSELPLGMGA